MSIDILPDTTDPDTEYENNLVHWVCDCQVHPDGRAKVTPVTALCGLVLGESEPCGKAADCPMCLLEYERGVACPLCGLHYYYSEGGEQ